MQSTTDSIYLKISEMRERLGLEYIKCYEECNVDENVIRMSQELDNLILKYIKEKWILLLYVKLSKEIVNLSTKHGAFFLPKYLKREEN